MVFQLLSSPISFIIVGISLLFAITIHEFAHAWVADRLGDPTPRLMGRVTLNPLAHLDPIGTLALLLVGFGWGKPVPFDPFNLSRPQRDSALIALAGPASNIIVILILAVLLRATEFILLVPLIQLNLILALFNLIPIHPLDGFKIVGGFLSKEQSEEWYKLEPYGIYFLLFMLLPIINGQSLLSRFLSPLLDNILSILLG
jgi:Zn-dependent protease